MPASNTSGIATSSSNDTFPRAWASWLCLLPTYLLALRDAPLTTSLKVGCCEGLLCHFAFVLSRVSFAGEGLKGEEMSEDNSSARVSTSSGSMSSFPLLRAIERTTRTLFGTSFPRSRLFSILAYN